MRDSYIQSAFEAVCKDAKQREAWYVVLMEHSTFYGGPQEGGWFGHDYDAVAWQEFPSEEAANTAKAEIEKLAAELTGEARRDFGQQCLREMDWLDARGLDADWLPEPDGPSDYYVVVSEDIPHGSHSSRVYE